MKEDLIIACFMAILLIGCHQDEGGSNHGGLCPENDEHFVKLPTGSQEFNLNLSLFLDLSDRIDTNKYPNGTMHYYERDLGYLESISHAFARHCRSKRFQFLNERFKVYFHPPPSNKSVNGIAKDLNLHLTKDNANKDLICGLVDDYVASTHALYEEAMSETEYPGSDIWSFFENKAMRNCVKTDSRNILVILTDGYMFYEGTKKKSPDNPLQKSYLTPLMVGDLGLTDEKWGEKMDNQDIGYLPTSIKMENLEVLVLGLNPSEHNSAYESDILKRFWSDWLESIGVPRYQIELNDLPADLDEYIQNFILGVE